ncbi:prepilin peptidase [Saccharothrix syringae]|uniref:Prepilin peptidase n=1 Tax=Saccharothrix syringae TaxID=103733 RepID=A0A5Q0H7B0_SACSY|nr:A24 family peptidase [Saccharothrix syringae]QFZ22097.1 prepilin peptidase [Saccharothrix syringae]
MVIVLSGFCTGVLGARFLRFAPRGAVVRPLWCAAPVAVLWWLSALLVPPEWLPLALLLAWLGVLLSAVDLRHRRLPDVLTLPAWPLVGAALWWAGAEPRRALAGGAVFFAGHLVVRLVAPSAMGGGDVKLAAPVGAVLASVSWLALPAGAAVASAVTLALALRRRAGGVPYGPGLLTAAWLAVASAG